MKTTLCQPDLNVSEDFVGIGHCVSENDNLWGRRESTNTQKSPLDSYFVGTCLSILEMRVIILTLGCLLGLCRIM